MHQAHRRRITRAARVAAAALATISCTIFATPAYAQVDFSGRWAQRYHEDQAERVPGGELGDFTGIPLNDAARLRADTWDAGLYGLPEWQCRPHGANYIWRSVHPVRIWEDFHPVTGAVTTIHADFEGLLERVVYMDGRPHPPEEALHTWAGFSTGKWEGDMLTVTTTHLKEYLFRRNGVPMSDKATIVEHWTRHDDVLTIFEIVTDPVYLTEPFVISTDFALDPGNRMEVELCEVAEESDHPLGWVPFHLPGTTHDSEDYAKKYKMPVEATRGGAETMYPAFRAKMKQAGQ